MGGCVCKNSFTKKFEFNVNNEASLFELNRSIGHSFEQKMGPDRSLAAEITKV
jgi:hypothetical protein